MVVWGSRSLWFSTCRFSWCIFFISQCAWCTEASCCRLASILPWFLASQVCRKWHGDEFCLQNPEVLSTKSSYSFKIHPDLRISLLVIQTQFHISSQEFQGNVSVVGGEVHKFHHLVNRKKIHKKPVPRLNHCHFLDEPFHNNYRSYRVLNPVSHTLYQKQHDKLRWCRAQHTRNKYHFRGVPSVFSFGVMERWIHKIRTKKLSGVQPARDFMVPPLFR